MKRNGPLLTLLAGIAVAAVLFLLSMQASGSGTAAQPAPAAVAGGSPSVPAAGAGVVPVPDGAQASPPGAPATVDKEPLAQRETPDGTWAGRLQPGVLALNVKDGKAIAYLCDGRRTEAWLKGTARDGKLDLTGKKGAAFTGTIDKKQAVGKVTIGGRTSDVDIKAVRKPSGLYRAATDVRGAKVVGGWIVLADGTQVGLATVGGRLTRPSQLDVTTGRATVDGSTVAAAPADPTR
ncbi:hypothetical protein [Actinoplanes sp. NPDC049599]|uniref:hypothetical protein n=1 Tax=Actinoplanes sp. NPDC049599 TaxID=3363903 RepID=UPI0037B66ED7